MKKDDRLDELLRHAARVFYDKGYDRASIRDIAKAAGMSLAGLYYYFRSKDELLYLIQQRIFGELLNRAREELALRQDPTDRLRVFIGNHLGYFIDNLVEMKVLSHEFECLDGEQFQTIAELRRDYYRVAEEVVGQILRDRSDAGIDARTATLSLFGMMNWIYTWYRPDRDGDADGVAERMTNLYLQGLLNG